MINCTEFWIEML